MLGNKLMCIKLAEKIDYYLPQLWNVDYIVILEIKTWAPFLLQVNIRVDHNSITVFKMTDLVLAPFLSTCSGVHTEMSGHPCLQIEKQPQESEVTHKVHTHLLQAGRLELTLPPARSDMAGSPVCSTLLTTSFGIMRLKTEALRTHFII